MVIIWNMDEMFIAGKEFMALKQQQQPTTEMTQNPQYTNNYQNETQQSGFNDYQSPISYDSQQEYTKQESLKNEIVGLIQTLQIPQPPLTQYVNIQQNLIIAIVQRFKVCPGQQIQINQNSFLYKHPNIELIKNNLDLYFLSHIFYIIQLWSHMDISQIEDILILINQENIWLRIIQNIMYLQFLKKCHQALIIAYLILDNYLWRNS